MKKLLALVLLLSTFSLAGSTPPIGGRINSVGTPLSYDNTTGALTMGTVPVNQGGTGQTTASAGLNSLLPSQTGNSGKALITDGSNASWGRPASGSVTSVGLSLPSTVFSVSGSPVTSSGTLSGSFNTQAANSSFMGPVGGVPGTPAFRSLVAADIPALSYEPPITAGTTLQYWRGDKSFQTLDTSVVPENTNLYYTQARFDSAFSAKSTTNLTEGSNLYYTDARVQRVAKNNVSAQMLYVSQDKGNDSTGDGSLFKPYATISAAVTAANLITSYNKQVIITVEPSNGTNGYNENVTLTQQGVNLLCSNAVSNQARSCLVNGALTVTLGSTGNTGFTLQASNEVYVSGFAFTPSNVNALVFNGTNYQKLFVYNSYFSSGSAVTAVMSNSGSNAGNLSGIRAWDTFFINSSSTNETITLTNGTLYFYGTNSSVQNSNATGTSVNVNGSSSASSMIASLVQLIGQVKVTDNTSTIFFNLSSIIAGSNPCIVTPSSPNTGYVDITYFGCSSSNTNSVTGSGVLVNGPGNNRFSSSGDIVSTVTQVSLGPGLPQGEVMIGAGATTGTNVGLSIKDSHIKVTGTAPTATVNANAGTSATCTLTNGRDSSGIINLTEGSASWASGTQCTLSFNKSWTVAPNCVFSPHNAAAASHLVSQQVFTTTTTTTLLLAFGVADSAATASQWSYKCEEP